MGVCILEKRVVLELSSSTNFVYSLKRNTRSSERVFRFSLQSQLWKFSLM